MMDAAINERELIARIIRGEKDEFRHLVLAHQEKVYAMIMRQVGNESIARELAQDTFLKAYLNLKKFHFKSSFSTWLIRIALNITSSYFSSRRYKERQRTVDLDSETAEIRMNEQEESKMKEEQISKLRTIIGTLPDKYREAIVFCGLEGKTYEQASEVMAIPVGTVRSRLFKARELTRHKFFQRQL